MTTDWSWVAKIEAKCEGVEAVVDAVREAHPDVQSVSVHKWLRQVVDANRRAGDIPKRLVI